MTSNPKPPHSGPTAAIPRDPQPSVDRIDDLARRILDADILLPKFQREFVWERQQVRLLLDSIANGFPIGSILLWQSRQELRSENNIADLKIKGPRPDYPVNYLLDGQQRLSTICGAMFWDGHDPKSPWNIAYDLREKQFLHLDTCDDPPLHQIRINKLPDAAAYFKHVSSIDTLTSVDKADLKLAAERLFNRFKDYKVASVTLGDMSIEDVAPIFERINSQGTPLTIVDLMRAATWSPQFDLIENIDSILEDLSEKGFDSIEKKVLLRNLSASAGGNFSVESIDQLRKHNAATLQAAADEIRAAYKRSVDFLATQLRVPSSDMLPYQNQLVVLAETFRRVTKPDSKQYGAITRWFWRSSISGYFSGWNTGSMAEDLKAIEAFAGGTAIELSIKASCPPKTLWIDKRFRMSSAHAKLLAIVLSSQTPLDLLTSQVVDTTKALAWENAKEFHHFFPQKFLESKGYKPDEINSLANIVFLSSASNKMISAKAPSEYLKVVQTAAGANLQSLLASNLISDAAFEAALRDDYDSFLDLRADHIHSTLKVLAGW